MELPLLSPVGTTDIGRTALLNEPLEIVIDTKSPLPAVQVCIPGIAGTNSEYSPAGNIHTPACWRRRDNEKFPVAWKMITENVGKP